MAQIARFKSGILLFIIIGISFIMTFAFFWIKEKQVKAVKDVKVKAVGYEKWKAPTINEVV